MMLGAQHQKRALYLEVFKTLRLGPGLADFDGMS